MTDNRQLIRRYEPLLRFGSDGRGRPEQFFPTAAADYVHTCGLRRKKVGWLQKPGQTLLNHLSALDDPDDCYLVYAAGDLNPGSGIDPQIALELLDYDLQIAREIPAPDVTFETTTVPPEETLRLLLEPQEAAELAGRLANLTAVETRPATSEELGAIFGREDSMSTAALLESEFALESFPPGPEVALDLNLEWLELPNFAALPQAIREHALEKYAPFRDWAKHPPIYHYHICHDRGYKVLQYWFLYPYNDWAGHGGSNDHEGDWEVIYIFLDAGDYPAHVAYSRHVKVPLLYGPATAVWQDIELVGGSHPVVYVGCGSHASYLQKGDHRFFLNIDWARGNHLAVGPDGDQAWGEPIALSGKLWNSKFSGAWGALVKSWIGKAFPHTAGPSGPAQKGDKWHHPAKWAGI